MKEHVAEIVAAFVKRNQVPASELPALIALVSQSLASLGEAPAAAPARKPCHRAARPASVSGCSAPVDAVPYRCVG